MGKCILMGFGGESGESFDKWAINNLISKTNPVPKRDVSKAKADWIKENFLTTYSDPAAIPAPTSLTKTALILWASNYFLMTTS